MVLYNVSTLIYDCDNVIDYINTEVENQTERITKHLSYINSEKEKLKEIKQQKKSINNDINEISSTILEDNKIFEISASYLPPSIYIIYTFIIYCLNRYHKRSVQAIKPSRQL